MPRSHPPAADLVDAVRELLEREVIGRLEGDLAFQCRVAANALGIVARELRLGGALDAAERQRLAALLGREGSLEELANELARRIRSGALAPDDPALLASLRASVADALRVNNPKWLAD
jgi:Domain of unknown function (DUF6285)